ncbi:CBS domain-containing protein [Thiothrix lacustris]|uniref:CBS domain-containing protein n=1 Tax=Thiothrix lacustris TaxID=525917 RepID=A0ABY9MRY7_9GAMM|nr:CBS domain-containing protein [Thiothrix lacustris]WML90155.1 CBS domain-containing protein [Thiothrix lacustris]WMP18248.1 CBS domain-containing protein [Thiothrix lacustris]
MKVKDIMNTSVKTAKPNTPVRDLVEVMCFNKISGMPVVDDSNNVVGVVSEKDVLRKMFPDISEVAKEEGVPDFEKMEKGYSDALGLKASDLMSKLVASASPEMPLMKAVSIMCVQKIRRIPVVEGGKLVGIISLGDVHKAIFANSLKGA